ncbi:MAG: sensor histidine kinase [Myxococcaceae bacterium]
MADLLESTRLQDGRLKLDRSEVSIAALVLRQVESLLPEEAKRLRVEIAEGLPQVWADADRLERVLANLVGNALKYSDRQVALQVELVEGELVVSVRDHGPGIGPEAQAHLFERYYRAPGAPRKEGLGLGLYIARQLVRAHGGRIWVESEPGRGSTFRFALPLAGAEQAEPPPPP